MAYVDPATGPGVVTVSDPRLNSDGSQGAAPFRRRKLRRSLGALPLTAAQATTIAQAWLAAYSQPTSKVEMVLRAVRDANGAPLPLSHVRADANLFTPELAARGQTLSTGPQPGVNQFYIVETKYHETADGDITLTLQLDNYADRVEGLLARLRLTDDACAAVAASTASRSRPARSRWASPRSARPQPAPGRSSASGSASSHAWPRRPPA